MVTNNKKKSPKRKKKAKTFRIEVGKVYVDPSKCDLPDCLKTWSAEEPMGNEYLEMMNECSSAIRWIAMNMNEGPEVKDSITKRIIALKTLINELVYATFLNNYMRSGLLIELLNDLYMDASGNLKVVMLLGRLKAQAIQRKIVEGMKKAGEYTA